jgi:hypothetical protein
LTKLILKDNAMLTNAAGKALASALAGNSVLTELDISSQAGYGHDDGPGFANELAAGISDNGALSIANVMGNRIGKEYLSKLQEIMHSKPNLVSLCGIADDATEVDLSGLEMDADDAIILAAELPDKRALSALSLKNNNLRAAGGKALAEGLKGNQVITELNIASNCLGLDHHGYTDTSGVIALADVIPDMGALSHFDISNSSLYAVGAKAIAKGLKGNQVMTELNISGNAMGKTSMFGSSDVSGVAALADVILGMGALIKLDISSSHIAAEQERDLQHICVAGGIELSK